MNLITIELADARNRLALTAEIDPENVLEDLSDYDLRNYCDDRGIITEVEVEYEVEVEVPEIEIPLSGPPQNLFEELCMKFDLPRLTTTKPELINHINKLI